jgi:hypothetical protein
MQAEQRADIWEEVWAEYDARQQGRPPVRPAARAPVAPEPFPWALSWEAGTAPPPPAQRRRVRPLLQVVMAMSAGLLLVMAWLALPWLLALRLSVPIGQNDAPGLLRQFDGPAAMASLRAGLASEIPEGSGEGARRYLTSMADRMATAWEKPEAVASWLSMRARGGRFEGSPVPLSALRSARPTGLTSFQMEYGPAHGEGGVAFDVAWQGDGFRVTGLRFLGTPPAPLSAGVPLLAMR